MIEPRPTFGSGPAALHVRVARLAEAGGREPELTDDERRAAARFTHPAVRARHVVARALRRHLLAECTGRTAADLRFVGDGAGKPRLDHADGWDFSTSHAGDLVGVAAARFPVGLDLEEMREVPEMERIVTRYFHPDEAAAWARRPPGSQHADFFRLWCAREAAMKCVGLGLAAGIGITRVDPGIMDEPEAPAQVGAVRLGLQRIGAPPGYSMVVALGL